MSGSEVDYAVVIPTVGRESLHVVVQTLLRGSGPSPREIIVVDDRPEPTTPLLTGLPLAVRVLRSGGRGPAAARNVGWRATRSEWVAFLDDDVVPAANWAEQLVADLRGLPAEVGASKAHIRVPLPEERRPTDAERGTAGLETARWITADMAFRRAVLAQIDGFDERFPRAYREDAELALRVLRNGHRIVDGERETVHPVRSSGFFASLRAQRGNADDALMRRLHGAGWRSAIGGSPGRLRQHALTTAAGIASVVLGLAGRKRSGGVAAALWALLTAEFATRRVLAGPREPDEVLRMLVTSVAIPPAACAHRVRGELRFWNERP
ncbi:MAG TPA: glycosyltransferase [Pseudonocardiaceae bacterium]|jgi:GT2 family glycosyltransferase|nr:glycosyltransferase [Pseudonocardiaceae bacterium]